MIPNERSGIQSPYRTYTVWAVEAWTWPRRIAGSNRPVRLCTAPAGSMNALIPDTPASTTHLPVSTARI